MKKNLHNSRHMETILSLLIVGVGTVVLAVFFDVWFTINDDVMIRDILSGAYTGTPNAHCIQILYPLGLLISSLYRLFPALNWYGLFMGFCHALCMFLILRRLLEQADGRKGKLLLAVLGILAFTAVLLGKVLYIQYTVTSAVLAGTAIFLFITTSDRCSPAEFNRRNIISMILFILAFCMRTEMVLLLCPLVAAAGLYKWSMGAKSVGLKFFSVENYRKYLITVLVVVLGMGACYLIDTAAYSSDEWQEFRTFFDNRTELFDFLGRAPEYEGNEEFYDRIGLPEAEVELLVNYNFALDDEIDSDLLQTIIDYDLNERGVGYFRYNLSDGFAYYRWQMVHLIDRPWMVVIVAGYVFVLAAGLLNGHLAILWQLLLLGGMRTVSWMYIFMRGRFFDRVNHSLYLCEILILMAMLLAELKQIYAVRKKRSAITIFTTFTVLVFSVVFGYYAVIGVQDALTEKTEMEAEYAAYYQPLQDYCAAHPDSYFLIDVYSYTTAYEPLFTAGDSDYRNYDICGGWAAKSPLYQQKLAYAGIDDLTEDLAGLDDVYFISKDLREIDWLAAYYEVKGYAVEVTAVDHIDVEDDVGYTVYAVSYAGE